MSSILEPFQAPVHALLSGSFVGVIVGLTGLAQEQVQAPEQDQHTIKSNIEYRLSRGDLPKLSFGVEKPKNVEVVGGGEELLKSCLSDTTTWSKDPLMFRLAHTHATEIQSCRENSSPSMHAIFLKGAAMNPCRPGCIWTGMGLRPRKAGWSISASSSITRSRFGPTTRTEMFENLQRSFSSSLQTPPDPATPLTGHERFTLFASKTLTRAQPYAASVMSSAFQLLSPSEVWGRGVDGFTNHLAASFTQRVVTYGLQSGAAAALHEDVRYRPSTSSNVWKRTGHALISTVVLETPRGDDIAYANIVAAFGSGFAINAYHPGREISTRPGAWNLAALNLLGFAQGNLWTEFKPDIKHLVRHKLLHRD